MVKFPHFSSVLNRFKKTNDSNGSEVESIGKLAFFLVAIFLVLCAFLINAELRLQRAMLKASGLSFEQRILLQKTGDQTHFLLNNIHEADMTERVILRIQTEIRVNSQRIADKQIELDGIIIDSMSLSKIFLGPNISLDMLELLEKNRPLLGKFNKRMSEISSASILSLKSGYNYWQPADAMVVSGGILLTGMESLNIVIYQASLNHNRILFLLYSLLLVFVLTGTWLIWFFTLRPLGNKLRKNYTELKNTNLNLKFQSNHDNLTKLPNRVAFNQKITFLAECGLIRNQMALILVDVDNFKTINDTFGHQAGDMALIEVAKRLTSGLEENESAYRLAGDEFALVFEKNTDKAILTEKATDIVRRLNGSVRFEGRALNLSGSLGIAWGERCGSSLQEIFSAADVALFHVKQDGRNSFQFYSDISSNDISELLKLEQEIQDAVDNREFIVEYQPIVDIGEERIIRLEALVRWRHPTRGVLLPGKWLQAAEKISLLTEINLQVFDVVEKDILKWLKLDFIPYPVNVNITEGMLTSGLVLDRLRSVENRLIIDNSLIGIEITESIIIDRSFELICKQLDLMQQEGINVSLDDFGTGFANLSHLLSLPFNTIKLDPLFTSSMLINEDMRSIIQSVIDLAVQLKKDIVCEGVDQPEIKMELLKMGRVYAQGFLFSKSVAFEEVCQWLKNDQGGSDE